MGDKHTHKGDKPTGERPRDSDSPAPVSGEEEEIVNDLEQAQREAQEYLSSLQRLQAEFENYRKRMLKEQTYVFETANQALVKALLPIVDNFERAIGHEAGDAAAFAEYRQGVELVYQYLLDVLQKEGLEVIDSLGEQFDPHCHEAMMQEPTAEHAENTCTEVFEKGYRFKGRVIRPARVKVSGPA